MSYTAAERETVIRCDDVDKIWDVYTAQPTMMTKLRRVGVEPYWTETEKNEKDEDRIIAAKYKLDWRQVSILSNKKRSGSILNLQNEEQSDKNEDDLGDE